MTNSPRDTETFDSLHHRAARLPSEKGYLVSRTIQSLPISLRIFVVVKKDIIIMADHNECTDVKALKSPLSGVRLQFVRLRSTGGKIRLRVATAGPKAGIPCLLMHGWPECWYSWRHQILFLARKGYRVIVPDMRGYGYSSSPTEVESFDCFSICADMVALLQEFGIDKAVLIGHDWGAALTWMLGLLVPEYFPAVAALSVPWYLRKKGDRDPIDALRAVFGEDGDEDQMFFYQLYHNERYHGTRDSGPAEGEYDANASETIRRIWTDASIPKEPHHGTDSGLRRDGGMFAHKSIVGGRPKRLPTWLPREVFDYVVEQYKHSGFRGGVSYYRNISRNVRHQIMYRTYTHDDSYSRRIIRYAHSVAINSPPHRETIETTRDVYYR